MITRIFLVLMALPLLAACQDQSPASDNSDSETQILPPEKVGGPCDQCELMYVDMPATIAAVDTSAGWHESDERLQLSGTIYELDGETPAADVILYYYHTDREGRYAPSDDLNPQARRHGHLRGWVKTGADGRFSIFTLRPASYPNTEVPAHIHLIIREPDLPNEYYVNDWFFADDPFLSEQLRNSTKARGGSGVLSPVKEGEVWIAQDDIILGLNVPGY